MISKLNVDGINLFIFQQILTSSNFWNPYCIIFYSLFFVIWLKHVWFGYYCPIAQPKNKNALGSPKTFFYFKMLQKFKIPEIFWFVFQIVWSLLHISRIFFFWIILKPIKSINYPFGKSPKKNQSFRIGSRCMIE